MSVNRFLVFLQSIVKCAFFSALIFSILSIAALPVASDTLAGRVSVIDGDTFEMHGKRIRVQGIDAPERGQQCKDANGKS